MNVHPDDTIVAIATATGGAARGIVRICGKNALDIAAALSDSTPNLDAKDLEKTPTVRRSLIDSIPCDLYIWPTNRCYARSPTVEIHTLGSPPLMDRIVRRACAAGARLAVPGEFTMRAFLAGRLDLTQAEAVLGVIDARGEAELHAALSQLAGGLAKPLATLRGGLLDLLAELEAGLDFADEDIAFISAAALQSQLQAALDAIEELVQQVSARSESGPTVRAVLTGPPNVGKSSLFNALSGKSAAIVSPIAGTTRDYLSARILLGDVTIELIDTAGLHNMDSGPIDQAAQGMTLDQDAKADLRLECIDATRIDDARRMKATRPNVEGTPCLTVVTKCDLAVAAEAPRFVNANDVVCTSSLTGAGLNELRRWLHQAASQRPEGHVVPSTAARCRESLHRARESLSRAHALAQHSRQDDLISAEIRRALEELGSVAGTTSTDDVLDRVFSRFCIGK